MKHTLTTAICLALVFFSHAEKPIHDYGNDFTATITTGIAHAGDAVSYEYAFHYSSANERPFAFLSIIFRKSLTRSEFIGYSGKADRNIPWGTAGLIQRRAFNDLCVMFSSKIPPGGKENLRWVKVRPQMEIQISDIDLLPGETARIALTMKNRETIPGIAELHGTRKMVVWMFFDAETEEAAEYSRKQQSNWAKVFRVPGPVIRPKGNPALIDHLIAITKESRALGWISKDDVYRGLMDKLEAARPHVLKGGSSNTPARNILGAFRNQLAAQRGKAVETACAAMLDINAAGLIKALGG